MQIKFKKNPHKEFLEREISNLEAYMSSLGPGKEYNQCLSELKELNERLDELKVTKKLANALPWLTLTVTAIGTIGSILVPVYGMNLAYKKEEEEGELKNGTIHSIATRKMK